VLGHVSVSSVTVHGVGELSVIILFGEAGEELVGSAARWALAAPWSAQQMKTCALRLLWEKLQPRREYGLVGSDDFSGAGGVSDVSDEIGLVVGDWRQLGLRLSGAPRVLGRTAPPARDAVGVVPLERFEVSRSGAV